MCVVYLLDTVNSLAVDVRACTDDGVLWRRFYHWHQVHQWKQHIYWWCTYVVQDSL